ncbi:corA-like Mg2+ transporter family protein [Yersinia ruckeri]|uniref:zinc transporter ZntB n=2 Tax=Yersinia ruckeri TaxID=29486 RepID=UPI0005ABC074|nr:zinc transporter ZntB [Yersinia ruckeri]AJI94200.1 corA-like Mg2+ transporter family protein [Yersinia ruckeri]MCW6568391.1 zinc transporter ZntB [Yersinia ruckeri]
MEEVAGTMLQISDAVYAYQLDGKGGVTPIAVDAVATSQQPCWLHLDYTRQESIEWLRNTPILPDVVRAGLAGDSLRPKVTRLGDGAMITLRGINFNADARPDQLVTIRVYMTDKLIVSTRHRRVYSIDDVLNDLQSGTGPTDSGSWLVEIADGLTDHTSEFIEELHDKIIDLEDNLLEQQVPARGQMALLRKQLIVLRRYMAPQRDVFSRLASERLPWMHDDDRRRMQEISERLGRGLEDLDSSIARTAVLADEISSLMADAMNRRTYTMSLLAMVFLPTTFLTGLFGVNLGGIPGNEARFGFTLFCIMLVGLVLGVAWALKRSKWL